MEETKETIQIDVNVGGRIFTTTNLTLCNSPFFKAILESEDCFIPFIDRDPNYFTAILNKLRGGPLLLPKGLHYTQLQKECDYFGIGIPTKNKLLEMFENRTYCDLYWSDLPYTGLDSCCGMIWDVKNRWVNNSSDISVKNTREACNILVEMLLHHGWKVKQSELVKPKDDYNFFHIRLGKKCDNILL